MNLLLKKSLPLTVILTATMGLISCDATSDTTATSQQVVTAEKELHFETNIQAPFSKVDKEMDAFIDDLLSKMTLEEKIGQTVLFSGTWDVTGPVDNAKDFTKDALEGKVGAVFNALTVDFLEKLQRKVVENSRLGIPLLFGYDVIHGYKTTFPTPLAQSASWDLAQIEKSTRIATTEASADGLHWTFAPMVDIARDPRWGRIAEGAGEDHYLGSLIAQAHVRGIQGDDLSADNTMLSTAKHYAAYGAAQAGRDYHTVDMSDRRLREIYLPPFKAALDAGAATFMTSFNELNGEPASGNSYLLNDILRDEWGFNGFVVTDYTSILEMIAHGNVATEKEAGELAINSGVDMDMQSDIFQEHLGASVSDGQVSIATIEQAARRILEMKYRLGLFEDPYRYFDKKRAAETLKHVSHFEAAREMSRKSIVLLKNEDQLLPLKKDIGSIALIGPMGDETHHQLGTWHTAGRAETVTSIHEALKATVSTTTKIHVAKGADFEGDDRSGFAEAVAAAKKSDVILLAVGERENMSGEAASRVHIDIPVIQKELINELHKLGKPMVLLLHNGRPLTITWEDENIPSILEVWQLGSQAGPAIADVLFGDYNPSGKLTVTFPRHLGQVPIHYNMKNTGRPMTEGNYFSSRYQDMSNSPLYPFGFGLSYTDFSYSALSLDKSSMKADETLKVSFTLENIGKYRGEEVVQLYIKDKVGSVTRPVKELKGFQKINLTKGEKRLITFEVTAKELAFYRKDMSYGVEAGDFEIFIGTNSRDGQSASFTLTESAKVNK